MMKHIKDALRKVFLGKSVPAELFELSQYFRMCGPIQFEVHEEGGMFVAVSRNFRQGSIVTSCKDRDELEQNIQDAILTSFGVPAVYHKQAGLKRVGDTKKEYAFA